MTNQSRRYIDTAECAKLIRAALKAEFPTTKFSVRISRYAGGSSIRVGWVDGPKIADVEHIARYYKGSSFDGMTDMKNYHDSELDGEIVHFGADHVFCEPGISPERREEIEAKISAATGRPFEKNGRYDSSFLVEGRWYSPDGYGSFADEMVWRVFNESGHLATDEAMASYGPEAQRIRRLSDEQWREMRGLVEPPAAEPLTPAETQVHQLLQPVAEPVPATTSETASHTGCSIEITNTAGEWVTLQRYETAALAVAQFLHLIEVGVAVRMINAEQRSA